MTDRRCAAPTAHNVHQYEMLGADYRCTGAAPVWPVSQAGHDVAAAIIVELDKAVDTMTIHKLLYLCQAWSLGLRGVPLFDDRIEAAGNGPRLPGIYAHHGSTPSFRDWPDGDPIRLEEAARLIVHGVVQNYGAKSGPALSRMTREDDCWAEEWIASDAGRRGIHTISEQAIHAEYRERALRSRKRAERRERVAALG
ncbi:DUF4065 domain-containing protein (plasmid) [Citricoccus nitrophenolicus]